MKNTEPLKQPTLVAYQASSVPARAGYTKSPYHLETAEDDDTGAGLIAYWHVLRRNKRVILLASLAGLIAGFAVGVPMKPVYRAKTTLEVLVLNEDYMNMKQANPTTTNDGNYDTSEEQTQAKLLESRALLNRVVARLDPTTQPSAPRNPAKSGWRSWLHLPEPSRTTLRRSLLQAAAASLKVRPTSRTRVIEITADSTDRKLATDFANTLTEEFIAMYMEARWATTQRTSDWLRRELDDARNKLRNSEDALQTYARGSGLIFTDETTNVATEKLQQVQQNLSLATADRIAKQSRYELAQNAPPDSLADVLTDTSLRDTQSKINELKRQIADLGTVYAPEYSKIRRLEAELDTLQPVFNQQRADILTRIKNDFTEASRRERLLNAAYDSQAQNVSGQDEKAIQYNILKRDVDSNRQLYDTMLQQMKQASIASAMRASNVRVVDPAEVPDIPIAPNFKVNAGLGFLAGSVLSIVFATLKERADRTLQQPGDIKLWAELPEIGTIPNSSTGKLGYYARSQSSQTNLIYNNTSELAELATLQSKPSIIAEAFRSTLTSILFIGENGTRPKVLVVTSANAGDGKTTAVSNIAIAAAEIGMRVLIIDADLRRPRIHQLFNVENSQSLCEFLQGSGDRPAHTSLIKKTGINGLDVIPAGQGSHSAAHLMYSPLLRELVEDLRNRYDMILMDTPPMLQMTDARVAGRLADAVILVARANRTTRDLILAAKNRLAEDHTPVLGAILNDWDPHSATPNYYGYYKQRYQSVRQS